MTGMEQALQLDISPQARTAIESYLRLDTPNECESISPCLSDFRNWCVEVYEMPSLICLRNDSHYTTKDRRDAIKHMNDYFASEPRFYPMCFTPYRYINEHTRLNGRMVRTRYKCEKYLHEHIGDLAEHACIGKYGSVKKTVVKNTTPLFVEWLSEEIEE